MTRKSRVALLLAVLCAALALAMLPRVALAQEDRAEGALFLLLPVGAQGVSLGRAVTWVAGPEGAFWNPAGLAGIDRSQAVLVRGDHPAGTATAATVLWAARGAGTLGASYYLLDAGEIEQTDEFGRFTGTISIRNHLGIISAATMLGDAVAAWTEASDFSRASRKLRAAAQLPAADETATVVNLMLC